MGAADYVAFSLAIGAALISPGPAFVVMLRAALARGRRPAVLTGLGLATAATLWTGLALLGLAALFAAAPVLWIAFKLAGAAYLIWLAVGLWRGADLPLAPVTAHAPSSAFLAGILVNLSNPKAVLFIAAIFATLLPGALSTSDGLRVLALHFTLEASFYTGLGLLLTTRQARAGYLAAKAPLDRIAAGALGLLGLRIATAEAR